MIGLIRTHGKVARLRLIKTIKTQNELAGLDWCKDTEYGRQIRLIRTPDEVTSSD